MDVSKGINAFRASFSLLVVVHKFDFKTSVSPNNNLFLYCVDVLKLALPSPYFLVLFASLAVLVLRNALTVLLNFIVLGDLLGDLLGDCFKAVFKGGGISLISIYTL